MGLPDFRVPIELEPGHRRSLLARDVPAYVFWQGYPDLKPDISARGFATQEDCWSEALLERVIVKPRLTAELVKRMGAARRMPTESYLAAIGYRERTIELPSPPIALLEVETGPDTAPEDSLEQHAFRAWIPPRTLRALIRAIAQPAHIAPSVLWAMPISEFIFNHHVLVGEETRGHGFTDFLTAFARG